MTARTIQQLDPAVTLSGTGDALPLGQADGTTKRATISQILGTDPGTQPWVAYAGLTMTQGVPISLATFQARSRKVGSTVDFMWTALASSSGTTGGNIAISLPYPSLLSGGMCGSAIQARGGITADIIIARMSGTVLQFHTNLGQFYGAGLQVVAGWELWGSVRYETA